MRTVESLSPASFVITISCTVRVLPSDRAVAVPVTKPLVADFVCEAEISIPTAWPFG
jgi:hypothetical protein